MQPESTNNALKVGEAPLVYSMIIAYSLPAVLVQFANVRLRADTIVAALILIVVATLWFRAPAFPRSNPLSLVGCWFLWSVVLTISVAPFALPVAALLFLTNDLLALGVFALFYRFFSSGTTAQKQVFSLVLVLQIVISFLFCGYQWLSGQKLGQYGVVPPFLDGSSAAAGASLFWMICSLTILSFSVRGFARWCVVFLIGGMIIMLSASGSRTFLAGSAIFILVTLSAMFIRLSLLRLATAVLVGCVMILSLLAVLEEDNEVIASAGVERFYSVDEGFEKRSVVVKKELEAAANGTYLTGAGRGAYEAYHGDIKRGMHSQFSRTLVELGVVGLILLLLFLISLWSKFWRLGKVGYELGPYKWAGLGIVLSTLGMMATYDILSQPRYLFGFSMVVGAVLGMVSASTRRDCQAYAI